MVGPSLFLLAWYIFWGYILNFQEVFNWNTRNTKHSPKFSCPKSYCPCFEKKTNRNNNFKQIPRLPKHLPPMWGAMRYDPNKPGPKRPNFSRYDWKTRADLFPKLPSFVSKITLQPWKLTDGSLKSPNWKGKVIFPTLVFWVFIFISEDVGIQWNNLRGMLHYEASLRLQQGIAIFSQGERRDLGRWGSRWCWKKRKQLGVVKPIKVDETEKKPRLT